MGTTFSFCFFRKHTKLLGENVPDMLSDRYCRRIHQPTVSQCLLFGSSLGTGGTSGLPRFLFAMPFLICNWTESLSKEVEKQQILSVNLWRKLKSSWHNLLHLTPPKTNGSKPENHPFEKQIHLNEIFILGFHVSFRGCKHPLKQFRSSRQPTDQLVRQLNF